MFIDEVIDDALRLIAVCQYPPDPAALRDIERALYLIAMTAVLEGDPDDDDGDDDDDPEDHPEPPLVPGGVPPLVEPVPPPPLRAAL